MIQADPVWEEMIAGGHLGRLPVTFLQETSSTNEVALGAAKQGAATCSLTIAETQSKGRGRLGKSWLSPAGTGLYFSMLLRPALAPADLPKITLAAGLAACKAVQKITGLSPMIKWPNDLLIEGKKFAGILAETGDIAGETRPVVILGIGINVNTHIKQFPPEIRNRATSLLAATGAPVLRGELLKEITDEIIRTISLLEQNGFPEILAEWIKHDATLGRNLQWVNQSGKIVSGISLGPDDNGLLKIRDKQGIIHEILSGDINLAR